MQKYILLIILSFMNIQAFALSLEEALVSAFNDSDDIEKAKIDFKKSIQQFPEALSGFLPDIRAQYSSQLTKTKPRGAYSDRQSSSESIQDQRVIVLEQSIFSGGGSVASLKAAQSAFRIARAQYYTNEQKILLRAIKVYLKYYAAKEKFDISATSVKANRTQFEYIQEKLNVGEATITELAKAKAALSKAETNKSIAYAEFKEAEANFKTDIGVEPANITIPDTPNDMPKSFDEFLNKSLANNQDVEAAKHNIKYNKANELVSKSRLLPQVGLTVQAGKGSVYSPRIDRPSNNQFSTTSMLSVTVPVLPKGGAVHTNIRAAKLKTRSSTAEYSTSLQQLNSDCIISWEKYHAARHSVDTANEGVEAAQIAYDGTVQEELVGSKTIVEVLLAEEALSTAKVSKVEQIQQYILSAYQIKYFSGQLTAKAMKLKVKYFSPEDEFKKTKLQVIGF